MSWGGKLLLKINRKTIYMFKVLDETKILLFGPQPFCLWRKTNIVLIFYLFIF